MMNPTKFLGVHSYHLEYQSLYDLDNTIYQKHYKIYHPTGYTVTNSKKIEKLLFLKGIKLDDSGVVALDKEFFKLLMDNII